MNEPKPHAQLTLESVDPVLIGVDVDTGSVPELMVWAILALTQLAPEPARCRLVVTGDFVESVKQRSTDEYGESFDLERGTGMVGGKTMALEDGTIDVLVHAVTFWVDADPEFAEQREANFKRMIVHEAQHVLLHQKGENSRTYSDGGTVSKNLRTAADAVLEEYRVELTVNATDLSVDDDWGFEEILTKWRGELAQLASVEYQQHLDPSRLFFGVLEKSHTVWKLLGYVVAEDSDCTAQDLSPVDVQNPLWVAMVAPHWEKFVEILRSVPPAHEEWAIDDRTAVVEDLASEFVAWLMSLGFEANELEAGWEFWIRDWTLLEVEV